MPKRGSAMIKIDISPVKLIQNFKKNGNLTYVIKF